MTDKTVWGEGLNKTPKHLSMNGERKCGCSYRFWNSSLSPFRAWSTICCSAGWDQGQLISQTPDAGAIWCLVEWDPAQICQLTAWSISEQYAAMTAQLSHPLAQLHGYPGRTCSALLSSRAVFPACVSPGLQHLQFPLLNLGVGEPNSFQNVI